MKMIVKKQMKLFLEIRHINYIMKKINANRAFLRKHKEAKWDRSKKSNDVAYTKWFERRKKLYYEWHKISGEKINEFSYNHKNDIMEYYKCPKHSDKLNPFLMYYERD